MSSVGSETWSELYQFLRMFLLTSVPENVPTYFIPENVPSYFSS